MDTNPFPAFAATREACTNRMAPEFAAAGAAVRRQGDRAEVGPPRGPFPVNRMTRRVALLSFLALFAAARICAQVAPGMSEADLLAAKGAPSGKMLVGERTLYTWPDMTVITKNGSVLSVTAAKAPSRPPPAPESAAPGAAARVPGQHTSDFDSHWQDESQYIVENICGDLAGMYIYARTGKTPAPGELSVEAAMSSENAYSVAVHTASMPRIDAALAIRHNIFSADTYAPLLAALAAKLGPLKPSEGIEIAGLADTLTEPTAQVIESASQSVSASLEKNFSDPRAHEEAALVLAAFAMRDSSGKFNQLLAELCRMSAHLSFSAMLRGGAPPSADGGIAEAAMLCLMDNTADSQAIIHGIPESEPGFAAWRAAMSMRNTFDLHKYENLTSPSLLEDFTRFSVVLVRSGEGAAWNDVAKLDKKNRELADWGRMAARAGYGVEVGHRLLATLIPAEFQELRSVMEMLGDKDLSVAAMMATLNIQPGRCVSVDGAGAAHVTVIDRGLWGAFIQRHLCQAIAADFYFLNTEWGVPDDAREFRKQSDKAFWGLELYPFVRRQDATDEAYYRSAQDDEMALVRSTPQVVPADVWNYVSFPPSFCPKYCPPPHPFINEWHRHNPPQGTAYDVYPRLFHPSLMNQPDTVARLERLHAISPWNLSIDFSLMHAKHGEHPTGAQMIEAYRDVVGFNAYTCASIAEAFEASPELYETWMGRAAKLSPTYYYSLAIHLKGLKRDDEAASDYETAIASDSDDVHIANNSQWLVEYYETHGRGADATRLADKAAAVYSSKGLQAKASLLEMRRDYDGAMALYGAIKERYHDAAPTIRFLLKMQAAAPSAKYAQSLKAESDSAVTGGLATVEFSELRGAPADGMLVSLENDETRRAGLQPGDIVVSVHGYRVRDFRSYKVLRDVIPGSLDLVLWRTGTYLNVSASPPDNRFGVDFSDYRAK